MFQTANGAIFLHGWAANRSVFDNFLPKLTGFNCTAIDLPGHGTAPFENTFALNAIADRIADYIVTPQHLFGWSLGGHIALILAYRHPQKVRTLTICAGFARYGNGLPRVALATTQATDLLAQDFSGQMQNFLRLQALYAPETTNCFDALLPSLTAHGTPPALYAAKDAVLSSDIRPLLPDITAPTLLLFGEKDRMTPPQNGIELHNQLPHSVLHLFPNGAHMPFVSQAEECAALVRQFWKAHS